MTTTAPAPGAVSTSSAAELISACIADILGFEPIDPQDNIFDLGMDSLSLVDLRDAVRKAFGVQISFTDFFSHYTVEGLAALVATRKETH